MGNLFISVGHCNSRYQRAKNIARIEKEGSAQARRSVRGRHCEVCGSIRCEALISKIGE